MTGCSVKRLQRALSGSTLFGRHRISRVNQTSSTNDDLKNDWLLPEVVEQIRIADYQTAGRGQHQRNWLARPGQSLLFSFSLTDVQSRFPLSMIAGLAVYNALNRLAAQPGSRLWLKWPNDLWLNRGKLAGILCEGCSGKGGQRWVVGIGINLAPISVDDFTAASFSEISENTDSEDILCEFFADFERLLATDAGSLVGQWSVAASVFWQTRFMFMNGGMPDFCGLPLAIEADGTLLVESDHKKCCRLLSATLKPLF
jgi:biotin-[acetyl-CoA-carboxylase] ligase BirA-like protein